MSHRYHFFLEETKEGHERAGVYYHDLKDAIFRDNPNIILEVKPATKGGPYVGWHWTGNFKITFKANDYGIQGRPLTKSRYFADKKIDKIRQWYDHIRDELNGYSYGCKITWIYRRSGLIPKRVAKRHGKILKKQFGSLHIKTDKATRDKAHKLMTNYIANWAFCPHCGAMLFIETILGWTCENCRAYLSDTGPKLMWEDVKCYECEGKCSDNNPCEVCNGRGLITVQGKGV